MKNITLREKKGKIKWSNIECIVNEGNDRKIEM